MSEYRSYYDKNIIDELEVKGRIAYLVEYGPENGIYHNSIKLFNITKVYVISDDDAAFLFLKIPTIKHWFHEHTLEDETNKFLMVLCMVYSIVRITCDMLADKNCLKMLWGDIRELFKR